jgi:hypothetical protein
VTPLNKKAVERGEAPPIDIAELELGILKHMPLRYEVCHRAFVLTIQVTVFWTLLCSIVLGGLCGLGGVYTIPTWPNYAIAQGTLAALVSPTASIPSMLAYCARKRKKAALLTSLATDTSMIYA